MNEGYTFAAEIFSDQYGAAVDTTLHPPAQPAHSAMHHFADALLRNIPHDADARQGLIVMEILDAIYASAQTGAPVQIASALDR